ncbi:armadillo-type protein [Dioszegia hungarica]|uniref:Armadillo-type protein n=1 Tax=Dioszegia hungarica TaxID=4972 RepID=A0AA38LXF0_9TREE|nr:armadillo-type protein [Dioszegia hungarica]KAI9638563.1 armadillo-type protein [Dioszegia hungarica]
MSLASTPPTQTSAHARLLSTLLSLVEPLPSAAFTQSMINYLLFPLTQILRSAPSAPLPEAFLESAFRLMGFIVSRWRDAEGGIDIGAWEQLWRFTVASVTPNRGKGKGKDMGQEVHLEAISLLSALLAPTSDDNGLAYPTRAMRSGFSTSKSPLLSTLFQTISYLLSQISPSPPHRPLQLASLRLLRPLIEYLSGQHPVLASLLPGTISGVAKLISAEGRSMRGEVAAASAGLVEDVIRLTLSDEVLLELGVLRGKLDDLSQLAEEWERGEEGVGIGTAAPPPPSPAPSASTVGSGGRGDPFPPLTASYLAFTAAQLGQAIPQVLATLAAHPSDVARTAAASLVSSLLQYTHESLPALTSSSTRTLLFLSEDTFDPVQHFARNRLRTLSTLPGLDIPLVDILSGAMSALPRLITSGQDDKVKYESTIISAIAEIIQSTPTLNKGVNAIADLLGPAGKVERWGWALLDCLEFGRPAGWSQGNEAGRAAQLGWASVSGAPVGLLEAASAAGTSSTPSADGNPMALPDFPHMPFRYLESPTTARTISRMLVQIGRAGGEGALHTVEYFLLFARNYRRNGVGRAVPALWCAQRLLDGVAAAQVDGPEGRVGRKTRRMAKEAVGIVTALDEEEDGDEGEGNEGGVGAGEGGETSDALLPIERGKGLNALSTLIDRPAPSNTYATSQTRRLHSAAQRSLLTCQSLSLLALSARILSSSFRPLLLNSQYTVLSHLASPAPIVRDHASLALAYIALHTGYPTPRDLVLDNVDYVINVVSRRLSPSRLSVQAPLVLIAMIRLVGSEIVPLVHDVVDEIFDALDDYHGYETLASSLLAVLVCLIQVMSADVEAEGMSAERKAKIAEMRRVDKAPEPDADFLRFEGWLKSRGEMRQREVEEIIQRAPEQDWGKIPKSTKTPDEEEESSQQQQQQADDEIPLTRAQDVCKQILTKSIFFLSHQNPFLRSRVLALITAAIPVLASGNREGDLLPLIDRGWGMIIARLGDTEGYVVTAAAEVIASLAQYTGDYMSRRILDYAWPKFVLILKAQAERDAHSALVRTGAGAGAGMASSHTTSHRLHIAILRAMKWVAGEVPVDDKVVWGMMCLFRPFLDKRANGEVQDAAREVYGMLKKRDGDMLWVVLTSSIGDGQGVWGYLREPGLDIKDNVDILLAE